MRVLALSVVGVALALSGCEQLTSTRERTVLEAAATKAGQGYVDCIVQASDRYPAAGADAGKIVAASQEACSAARSAFVDADTTCLKTRYVFPEELLKKDLAALDERATAQVGERLRQPGAAPPAGNTYLDCMRAQGQRYASVNEPATVVAEVAQSRCATLLTDPASAAQLERQGRALVMGMVLDRKVGP